MQSLTTSIVKYIKDPEFRFNVNTLVGINSFLPDKYYLKKKYRVFTGHPLNLDNPQTFNEKLQWLKIYDRNPIYTKMVDKIEAKNLIAIALGEQYIIPTLGVWDRFEEIDFAKLPNRFVLKCSHDSGGLVICRDKSKLDIDSTRSIINRSLKYNYFWSGREWPYKNVKPRILAEQYMENDQEPEKGLVDYKFFCFNGKPSLLYISKGLEYHPTAEISFYDMNGTEKPFHRRDYKPYHNAIMPINFDEMKNTAGRMANIVGSPFVRIDLYSIKGQTYFSEITFSPCSGMIPFDPISADEELGRELILPIDRRTK